MHSSPKQISLISPGSGGGGRDSCLAAPPCTGCTRRTGAQQPALLQQLCAAARAPWAALVCGGARPLPTARTPAHARAQAGGGTARAAAAAQVPGGLGHAGQQVEERGARGACVCVCVGGGKGGGGAAGVRMRAWVQGAKEQSLCPSMCCLALAALEESTALAALQCCTSPHSCIWPHGPRHAGCQQGLPHPRAGGPAEAEGCTRRHTQQAGACRCYLARRAASLRGLPARAGLVADARRPQIMRTCLRTRPRSRHSLPACLAPRIVLLLGLCAQH